MQQKFRKGEQQAIVDSEYIAKPTELHESQLNNGNRNRLVLKFSLRDLKKPLPVEDTGLNDDDQAKLVYPSSRPPEETTGERKIDVSSKDPGSSSADRIDVELSRNQDIIDLTDGRQANGPGVHLEEFADNENKIGWGEIKTGTSKHSSSVVISTDASTGLNADIDVPNDNKTDVNRDKAKFGSEVLLPLDSARNKELAPPEDL